MGTSRPTPNVIAKWFINKLKNAKNERGMMKSLKNTYGVLSNNERIAVNRMLIQRLKSKCDACSNVWMINNRGLNIKNRINRLSL